jgi:hypothetical protein
MRNHFLRASSGSEEYVASSASISGKLFYRSNGTGGFGAFWQRLDGTLNDLEINPSGITAFNERTATIQTGITDAWKDFEIDLTGLGHGRVVFYGRRGSSGSNLHRADFCLDDILFTADDGTTVNFDPSLNSVRSINYDPTWSRSNKLTIDDYADAKSELSSVSTWSNPTTATVNATWEYEKGNTPSSYTGPKWAADGNASTYYVFFEATNSTNGYGGYLRWANYFSLSNGSEI